LNRLPPVAVTLVVSTNPELYQMISFQASLLSPVTILDLRYDSNALTPFQMIGIVKDKHFCVTNKTSGSTLNKIYSQIVEGCRQKPHVFIHWSLSDYKNISEFQDIVKMFGVCRVVVEDFDKLFYMQALLFPSVEFTKITRLVSIRRGLNVFRVKKEKKRIRLNVKGVLIPRKVVPLSCLPFGVTNSIFQDNFVIQPLSSITMAHHNNNNNNKSFAVCRHASFHSDIFGFVTLDVKTNYFLFFSGGFPPQPLEPVFLFSLS
jgi:hypothetical protein